MRRRAVIHIGTAKTGTTTIQHMLAVNRSALIEQGFAFPTSPGEKNHTRLAIYAGDPLRGDKLARNSGEPGDAAWVAGRFADDLAREMAALPRTVHTCVFSNEHLYRKVATADEARRLRGLLDRHFDDYRVIAYLRRQDELAVSVYSTRLRSGSERARLLPDLDAEPVYLDRFDWAAMLDRWAAAFGREAILPRLFGRAEFLDGDLLTDFRAASGIIGLTGLEHPPATNSALSAAAQEFLRRLNARVHGTLGAAEEEPKAPPFVRGYVDQHHSGRGRRPARAEAAAFLARFDPSNERLRAGWFPHRPRVFDDDLSRYPEVADPVPSDAEVLEVALGLIARQAEEEPAQLAATAYDRGRERQAAGDVEQARRLYHRTLVARPGHAGALRGLFELAAEPAQHDEAAARLRRALAAAPEREELRRVARDNGVAPPADQAAVREERRAARREERRSELASCPSSGR